MSDLQDRLRTAGNLARLQAIIDLTREPSASLANWPADERQWFARLLTPFAENQDQRQLALLHASSLSSPPPTSELLDELLQRHAGNPEAMVGEVRAIIQLLRKLLGKASTFDGTEVDRVRQIADGVRRRLLQEQSFHQRNIAESSRERTGLISY